MMPCRACNPEGWGRWAKRNTGLYGELWDWKLERTDDDSLLKEAKFFAEQFAEHPRGWLAFHGRYGVGKSWFMVGIVRRCWENGVRARYVETAAMLQEWRDTFGENDFSFARLFEEMATVPVLALDEFNEIQTRTGRGSVCWTVVQLGRILRRRHNEANGTVVGMSLDDPGRWMREHSFGAVWDRLKDDRNWGVIKLGGLSRRYR